MAICVRIRHPLGATTLDGYFIGGDMKYKNGKLNLVEWGLDLPGGKQCSQCKQTPFSARKRRSTGIRSGGYYRGAEGGGWAVVSGECEDALHNEGKCRYFVKRKIRHIVFGVEGVKNTG